MASLSLDSSVQYVKGVGPHRAAALSDIGVETVLDLLNYFPRGYIDRSNTVPIGEVQKDQVVTIVGRVLAQGSMYGGPKRRRYEIILGDDSGHISLLWFAGSKYLEGRFSKGDQLAATGVISWYNDYQIIHPELEPLGDTDETVERIHTGRIVPLYPSSDALGKVGLSSRGFRRAISFALQNCADIIGDHLDTHEIGRLGLIPLTDAIRQIHYPDTEETRESARRRLAFDELAELQYLALSYRSEVKEISKGRTFKKPGQKVSSFAKALPYKLTSGQRGALKEIYDDLASDKPMNRLLQGDVGCGKTVVAVAAMVYAAENKTQCAYMAPTELLADQQYRNWKKALGASAISCDLLTGSVKPKERELLISRIAAGKIDIVFGTHALISESVAFKNLGLVIIDEQHRFGVAQRAKLIGKGKSPDILVMSATPIPRTLALTLYSDLDFSTITELPPGRRPIKTVWRMGNKRPDIYRFIAERIAQGEQAFVIYPLVTPTENSSMAAAEREYQELKKEIFPKLSVDLVHGQMKSTIQEKRIKKFAEGKTDILVATTVIEVGVDIPGATVMLIEHAERFGLAQLHQLRGRIGRGNKPGYAVAIPAPPISDHVRQRLNFFVKHSDGFEIAEADLKLRGAGEVFGLRQHGDLNLRMANLSRDRDLLESAREWLGAMLDEKTQSGREQSTLAYYARRSKKRQIFGAVA